MKFLPLVFLAFCFSFVSCSQYSISSFGGPPFTVKPDAGMYELGGLNLEILKNGAQIVAYGDFDNNKYTDIVTLDDSLRTLTISVYSHSSFSFSIYATLELSETIVAVIPGDYNYDGKLDLLVVIHSSSSTNPETHLKYFFRSPSDVSYGKGSNEPDLTKILPELIQPFVFDIEGDRNLDVLFFEEGVRKVQSVENGAFRTQVFSQYVSTAAGCKDYSKVANNVFTTPHSNSFLDFNGDCAADLFLTTTDGSGNIYFEFWLRNLNDKKFCLVDVIPIKSQISVVSFGDINHDGRLDLIYASQPENSNSPMKIHVAYNTFASDPSSPCTLINTDMVSPYKSEAFNSEESNSGANLVVTLPESYSSGTRLYNPDPINRPSRIRVGDMNIDGHADLLFVVNDPQKNEPSYGSVVLLMNQGGTLTFDRSQINQDDEPYFEIKDDNTVSNGGAVDISELHAQYASFFDFDEIGRLGFWIVVGDKNSPASSLVGIFNFVSTENFILKTVGLNGYTTLESENIIHSLGGIYYGCSVECKVSDIDGKATLSKGAQMPQSAYTPLDLPYIFIGLGRTNNYIENFVLGISTNYGENDLQKQLWTPIIPNSQLIVNTVRNGAWTIDIFVNPTSETILIVLTTLAILVVLGVFIIYLHAKEKEDDLKKRTKIVVM